MQTYSKHYMDIGKTKSSLMKFEHSVVYQESPSSAVFKMHIEKLREICPDEQIGDLLGEAVKGWTAAATVVEKRKTNDQIKLFGTVISPNMVLKLGALLGIAILGQMKFWFDGKGSGAE